MRELKAGMFARSLAGHDKGKLYIVVSGDDSYVYLTDGRIRPLQNPKKKKRKHIQPDFQDSGCGPEDWTTCDETVNAKIQKIIKTKEVIRCQRQM
ncbi:MAG: KOW domain-containing RNA-binding protein [Lachnospiraceae bacterium]|nr:KOW domain-containing RNA-binding protein [Lachnospiraceae bacterium]